MKNLYIIFGLIVASSISDCSAMRRSKKILSCTQKQQKLLLGEYIEKWNNKTGKGIALVGFGGYVVTSLATVYQSGKQNEGSPRDQVDASYNANIGFGMIALGETFRFLTGVRIPVGAYMALGVAAFKMGSYEGKKQKKKMVYGVPNRAPEGY